MSGGSWDYFYFKLDEVANRLKNQKDPLRRALGRQLKLAAVALKSIEWVDSGDCGEGDEAPAIRKALGKDGDARALGELLADAQRVSDELAKFIREVKNDRED